MEWWSKHHRHCGSHVRPKDAKHQVLHMIISWANNGLRDLWAMSGNVSKLQDSGHNGRDVHTQYCKVQYDKLWFFSQLEAIRDMFNMQWVHQNMIPLYVRGTSEFTPQEVTKLTKRSSANYRKDTKQKGNSASRWNWKDHIHLPPRTQVCIPAVTWGSSQPPILAEIWCPLMASKRTCTHGHTPTQTYVKEN